MSRLSYIDWGRLKSDQEYLFRFLLVASFSVHALIFLLSYFNLLSFAQINRPEWAIETELVADLDVSGATTSALPNAKKADKVAVPSNLLPQLSKNFAIKQKKLKEEGLEPGEEEALPEGKSVPNGDASGTVRDDERRAASQLKKNEALKRLMLERLRKQQKEKSREYRAEESNLMPRLKEALGKPDGKSKSGSGLGLGAETKKYLSYLKKSIRRNYSLPKTYELKNAKIVASLHVVINARGELVSTKIAKASGDNVFDQYCIEAVKKTAPFNKPPKERAGEVLTLNCNP